VVADLPPARPIPPYTLAESMDAGWCWAIPLPEEVHRGYVFSSRFLSAEQAEEEMRRKNPGMTNVRLVHFRSGRREHAWQGNVLAIGNAFAFVEPLESTGLHMIVYTLREALRAWPCSRRERAFQRPLNRQIARKWDFLRWFLAAHYRFNRKLDTPFWRACRQEADISGLSEYLDLFAERSPLSYRSDATLLSELLGVDRMFGLGGLDCLLTCQDVGRSTGCPVRESRPAWLHRSGWARSLIAGQGMEQGEALELLGRHPELLPRPLAGVDPLVG
jgi:tryptophan halogenase